MDRYPIEGGQRVIIFRMLLKSNAAGNKSKIPGVSVMNMLRDMDEYQGMP